MNKKVRIFGALFLGVIIIGGALYLKERDKKLNDSLVVIGEQGARAYIPSYGADTETGNWEEELRQMTLRAAKDAPVLDTGTTTVSDIPTTLTESFARSFFESYVRTEASGALTDQNKGAFLDASIGSLETQINDKLYTRADIEVSTDDSAAYLRRYGNEIAAIIIDNSLMNENELAILERALATEDASALASLTNIANAYDAMLTGTLYVAAPPALVREHIALTNAFLVMRNDIEAMSMAFTDPLYSMLRVKRYQDDTLALYNSLRSIYMYLFEHGITYTADEPASMFKIEKR